MRIIAPLICCSLLLFARPGALAREPLATPAQVTRTAQPEISLAGHALLQMLQSMDVTRHWLSGHERVQWETGEPQPNSSHARKSTHCSAFTAAAAERLEIYILREPDHSAALLASAQQEWLNNPAGIQAGWRRLSDACEAREQANLGKFVVASFKNPDVHRPGHIAVVLPSNWSDSKVKKHGCEIMQAGAHNFDSTSLRQGFANHRGAFSEGLIEFHVHDSKLGGGK